MLAFAAEQKAPGAIRIGGFFRFFPYTSFQSSLYFLPIHQSLSHIIQLYGKGDYFPLISLERLGILFGFLE